MNRAAFELAQHALEERRRAYDGEGKHHDELAEIFERMADRLASNSGSAEPPRDEHPRQEPMRASEPCSEIEDVIMSTIRKHLGSGNGISAGELAAAAKIDPRRARALIAHLIVQHKEPICSTSAEGYFWPRRLEDLDHTIASLRSRRMEIEARIEGLAEGGRREFGTAEFEFGKVA